MLWHVLPTLPEARIELPSPEEARQLARELQKQYRHIPPVWGFVDGSRFDMVTPKTKVERLRHWHGQPTQRGYKVACVVVFRADGPIAWKHSNCPGSWHDSHIAEEFYQEAKERYPDGPIVVADQIFRRTKQVWTKRGLPEG
jgi:hypothetical protein